MMITPQAVETDGVDGVAAHMAEHSDKKGGLGLLNAFFRGDGPDMRKGVCVSSDTRPLVLTTTSRRAPQTDYLLRDAHRCIGA
eukprot:SAG11_NODE_203_length_12529_cov_6.036444_7_plen_83_part_00